MPRRDPEDDDSDDGGRSSLLNGGSTGTAHDGLSGARWPWVVLGVFLGLLAVLFVPANGGSTLPAAPAGAGGVTAAQTSCGAVPLPPPPLVRRRLDGTVKNVLVTGGAGFIASHFALALLDRKGFNVTVVDDLSRGSIETILRLQTLAEAAGEPLQFVRLDVNEEHKMYDLLKRHSIDMVVHFSGNAYVGESMVHPEDYYQNITASTVAITRAMNRAGVQKLIFSSSCATFGAPETFPITEASPQRPTNPYGQAKLQAEQAIVAFLKAQERQARPFSASLLRYFNVIGADPQGRLGPHLLHPAMHKYPRILDATYDVALGLRPELQVTGSDFPTKDGSAQRDYIHVTDLVDAHVQLMFALRDNELLFYNVGNGQPYTVLEIVEVAKRVSGKKIPVKMSPRRPGDPPILYTDPKKIKYEIGWSPKYADIESMIRHGWDWRVKNYGVPPAPSIDPLQHNKISFTAENDAVPRLKDNPRIVIVGAGPTGLCGAWRLHELGYTNWELVEGTDDPAGLACTIKDEKDFMWDIGVHCLFSHFGFFDALLDDMLPPKDWLYHQRYSPARMRDTWVGYPVQANVWRLPEKEVQTILTDLAKKDGTPEGPPPRNFNEFLVQKFGQALTDTFMAPYNAKVWAHPANEMNHIWVGERVAAIKSSAVLSNVINRRDAPKWGPNAQFRYPMNGTGHIWTKIWGELPKARKSLGARVQKVRTKPGRKVLELANGRKVPYDAILSTMPIVNLLRMTPDHPELAELSHGNNGAADKARFKHQTVNLVGVGVWGTSVPPALDGVHWVYFPESDFVFYRVTVLSNFSPEMVAKPYKQWSLLIEVSESKHRHYYDATKGKQWRLQDLAKEPEELKRLVIDGLYRGGMLFRNQTIASTWVKRLEYGYPVPYVERNMHVHAADNALRAHGIWSRGRFGSWKYEVGNQDHSCMLGVDAVDSMLFGGSVLDTKAGPKLVREATFNSPDFVNSMYRKYDRDFDPAALSRAAGRAHTFDAPPRRLKVKERWDWVVPHCDEKDEWLNRVREVMVALPSQPKWLIHGYETCGVAEVKRPMLEMLREGLNHHDRIPHTMSKLPLSGWVKHVVDHYAKLSVGDDAEYVFFTPATLPTTSSVFSSRTLQQAMRQKTDFSVWGSHVIEMPSSLHTEFCARVWVHTPKARKRSCPERVVTMADAVTMVSRRKILNVPLSTWKALLGLVSGPSATPEGEQLIRFGWHLLFGQPPVLSHRAMSRH